VDFHLKKNKKFVKYQSFQDSKSIDNRITKFLKYINVEEDKISNYQENGNS